MLTRQAIISALTTLQAHDFIRAASLGGSDATGRADELSDVDLFLFVAKDQVEPAAKAIDDLLRGLSPGNAGGGGGVRIAYRLPMPTWHGFHQAFYQLADAPEHLMVDWLIVEAGTPHPWCEVERHGTHKVLFDKDGLVKPAHVDRAARDAAIRKRVEEIRTRFALFRHMGAKNAAARGEGGSGGRGLPVDAAHFYHTLALRPLVDLLRITHAPDRHDYGLRYLRDDLPPREYALVQRLAYPQGAQDIPPFTAEISREVERLLAQWDAEHSPR